MLSMYTAKSQKNWDEILLYISLAYNSSIHTSSKYSLSMLIYRREPCLPSDIAMNIFNRTVIQNEVISGFFKITEFIREDS